MRRFRPLPLWPLCAGLALVCLPFYRILLYSDRVLLFRDISRDFLAQKFLWATSVQAGHGIPYWNYFAYGGSPYYAANISSPLHPLNFLFLLFPLTELPRALTIFLFLHYPLFFFGAFFFLRTQRLNPWLCSLWGAGLAVCGYQLSVHNLMHVLASSVAVPWFAGFFALFLRTRKLWTLWAASLSLAWPVYAGDPQFSYVMAGIGVGMLAWQKSWHWRDRLRYVLLLAASSGLAAAAQLLPSLDLALQSDRFGMSLSEITSFSFHPLRLAETVYPLFFGSRYGTQGFWGQAFVNFPYKTPFIFSAYLGILVIFSLLLFPLLGRRKSERRKGLIIFSFTVLGFLLCFGVFSPLPFYEWAVSVLPYFSLFRYPERSLFWPLFGLWWLSALLAARGWRALTLTSPGRVVPRWLWPSIAFSAVSALFWGAQRFGFVSFPDGAASATLHTTVLLAAICLASLLYRRYRRPGLVALLFLLSAADWWWVEGGLVWDENKHIADGARYPVVRAIQADLAKRKTELEWGASRRLSTLGLHMLPIHSGLRDHTAATTFTSFDNLLPNVATYFGFEDIMGYSSLLPPGKLEFWSAVRDGDGATEARFLYDLAGAYYLPERDEDQRVVLKVNETAQPYLFVPEQVFAAADTNRALSRLRKMGFRPNRDLVVSPASSVAERAQAGERGVFHIEQRDGKKMRLVYRASADAQPRYLLWNESYDRHWRAYVNGEAKEVKMGNGWAMATELPATKRGESLSIVFRYENRLITIGGWISVVWLWGTALYFLCSTARTRRGSARYLPG